MTPQSRLVRDLCHMDESRVREPRTRNRAIKACLECRARKAKCDKAQPNCQNCRKYHRECTYITDKPNPIEREYLNRIKRKAQDVEKKRCKLPRLCRVSRSNARRNILQDDDSGESETSLVDGTPGDADNLPHNPLVVVDAAYDDNAEDEDPYIEKSLVFGHISMTTAIGGFFRPSRLEEVCRPLCSGLSMQSGFLSSGR